MNPLRWFATEHGRMSFSLLALCTSAFLLGSPDKSSAALFGLGWSLMGLALVLPLYSRFRKR